MEVMKELSTLCKFGVLVIFLTLSSCTSFRVLQKAAPNAVEKSEQHLESERVAGDFLARNVIPENKKVATSLSHSLGHPNHPSDNKEKISENLNDEISKNRKNQNQLNQTLNRYAGKEIEGTGIDLGKGLSITTIILIIVGVVAFPSTISILFFLLRQSRSALTSIVAGVEMFKQHDPEHGKELKECLNAKMDKKHKEIVERIK